VTMPGHVLLPWTFDAAAMAAEAEALPAEAWTPHFNTGIYDGDWSALALRAPVGGVGSLDTYPDPTATGFADLPVLERCPVTAAALASVPAPLLSARFLRLGAGAEIREHRDHRLGHADGEVRLHVPVTSPPGADLVVDGAVVPMVLGTCWYVDVSRPHRATNPGPGHRIHLVVDAVVVPALDEVLVRAASA
jgi:hypothetical protein